MTLAVAGSITSGYQLTKSLRFRSSASAYLQRTPASAGNQQKWTYSTWFKRGTLGTTQVLFQAFSSGGNYFWLVLSGDQIYLQQNPLSTIELQSTQVLRDPSAWYHLVLAVDTTQATASNRVKLYLNGSQITSLSIATYPAQNSNTFVNQTIHHNICANEGAGSVYNSFFDGYQTEINFIDGQALTPSSFGTTDPISGVWQPAKYTGTYGTNGFYLPFTDNSALTSGSNAGLGKDFSGNSNYWNTNNISITAGTTYDSMTDVPTLTNQTTANYCTLNPVGQFKGTQTISNGNLQASQASTSNYQQCLGTLGVSSGKWYWEWTPTSTLTYPTSNLQFGFMTASSVPTTSGSYLLSTAFSGNIDDGNTLYTYPGGASVATGGFASGDTMGLALDVDAGTLKIYVKNVLKATISSIPAGTYVPFIEMQGAQTNTVVCNFGQRGFLYTPPTGFVALNTYNLPNSTIVKGNTVMDATLYTGNGTNGRAITNAGAFQPDLVWLKDRSVVYDHRLGNSINTGFRLFSNSTSAESSDFGAFSILSNGFSVSASINDNNTNDLYVGWQWQAGQGTTSSNTDGSITSTVSVSKPAGFSVVTWTGNGSSGATVGHGLGVAPSMVIAKRRSAASNWSVSSTSILATQVLYLNLTNAATTDPGPFASTFPSSSVITLGSSTDTNASGGTFVAYCWAQIAGFSKFGSYTGNGSADGPFVYTGFRPKFVMIKCSSTGGAGYDWFVWDSARNTYNVVDHAVWANLTDAENTTAMVDLVSNGFKPRLSSSAMNANGATYIYAAFAENPFKNALAR